MKSHFNPKKPPHQQGNEIYRCFLLGISNSNPA